MQSSPQQIQVPKTLDVEIVERKLADLWKETAGESEGDEGVWRSRAADLMVFLGTESTLPQSHETIAELASIHACRALLICGDRNSNDRDIEMYVSAFCHDQQRASRRRLSCEEITLTACGNFVSELPSAAIPLLVPDLPVFLWWRDALRLDDKVFQALAEAADRLVIDSADFQNTLSDVSAVVQFLADEESLEIAVSDINWARLTSWRALLANFYDVQEYRAELEEIEEVRIDFVPQDANAGRFAAQPLLIAGWLASRLGWELVQETSDRGPDKFSFEFSKNNRSIKLELRTVERPAMKPGRLAEIELKTQSEQQASFVVRRSDDGLYIETRAAVGGRSYPGRMLPVRNRSTALLLGREMEILSKDNVYEEGIRFAAAMATLGTGAV